MKSQEKRQRGNAENAERLQRVRNCVASVVHHSRISESNLHRAEKREVRAARVHIFEPLAWLKRRSAAGEHNVFRERRAILNGDAEVLADGVVDRRLKKDEFKRLGAF